jgi:hypothetical protein
MVSFRLPREAFSQYESGTEVLGQKFGLNLFFKSAGP